MAGMALPGTRPKPIETAPAGSYWQWDTSYASDAQGNPTQNSSQPRQGSYRNTQGQTWDPNYGWVGAPQSQQSAMSGLSSARPSGSVTIGGGTYATGGGMSPQQQQQFDLQGAVGAQEQLDNARINAERGYQQSAVPMQIENMRAILNMLNETSASGGSAGRVTHGGAAESAARDAAYARAKDQIGLQTRGAIESLRDAYGGTGMIGDEHAALAGAAGRGFNQMGEVTREQLIRDLNRAAEVSDLTYQGDITQRGQDLSRLSALMNLSQAGVRSLY